MGLIDLKTNLKSLKYGGDRPGGGSSNQPYIVTPIPDDITTNSPDFLLRQGALRAALTDSERLSKFFTDFDSSRGTLFTLKQIALERQNPAMPGGLTRIYLPTSTLSQVLLSPEGFHLNKQGVDPFQLGYAQGGTSGYYNYTLKKDILDSTSRLSLLYDTKISNKVSSNPAGQKEFHISSDPNYSLSYSGGPDSIGGIGRTNIKLAGDGRTPSRDRTSYYNLLAQNNTNRVYTFDNNLLSQQESFVDKGLSTSVTDFRVKINEKITDPASHLPSTDYSSFNREKTYRTSITSYRPLNQADLQDPNYSIPNSSDQINSIDVQNVISTSTNTGSAVIINDNSESDLIKFFFEVIDPKSQDSSDFLFFRAYINSLGDTFKGEWQSYKYLGRAENFYKYNGFSRDISLSFTIYAHSRKEMRPLYEKLNRLAGVTAPRYGSNGYMLGNFVKLTVGTYIQNMPGIITSIDLTPSFEAGWDINRDVDGLPFKTTDGELYVGQVPRMIDVTLAFTPIHAFTPEYGKTFINNTDNYIKDLASTYQP